MGDQGAAMTQPFNHHEKCCCGHWFSPSPPARREQETVNQLRGRGERVGVRGAIALPPHPNPLPPPILVPNVRRHRRAGGEGTCIGILPRGMMAIGVIGLLLASLFAQSGGDTANRESVVVAYLGEARPYLIRIDVRVDGKPYVDVWDEAVDKIFRQVDADKDGFLDKDESIRLPP